MACNPDFVQYICDQCSGAGEIAVKKMMGDYCAYCLTALIKATIPALSKPKAKKNLFKLIPFYRNKEALFDLIR